MTSAQVTERRARVVEDDDDIRSLIVFTLSSQGFEVSEAASGTQGLERARAESPDLITLDIGLPGMDGTETCRRLREFTDAYVVMITGRDDEIDRLLGLETGADDFLTKPFSVRELKARVNALFRRPRRVEPRGLAAPVGTPGEPDAAAAEPAPAPVQTLPDHELLEHGPLRVDVDGRRAFHGDTELTLTRTEFDLLTELMRTPARVWTREALLRSVWGTDWATDTHLVEVHVGNLRRKIEAGQQGVRLIRTVRGVGYRMETLPA